MKEFLDLGSVLQILTKDYTAEVEMIRRIGVSQIGSDYSKYALGFYQLQSMSELAIVIRFSVYHIKRKSDVSDDAHDTEESMDAKS